MSSGNIESAADALAGAFSVTGARDMAAVIEALPEFCRALHDELVTLDSKVTEQAGPFLPQTGGALAAMAQHAAAMAEAAGEAASAWQEEAGFWLAGE